MPTPEGQNLINLSQQIINKIMGIQSDINALEAEIAAIKAKVNSLNNTDLSPLTNSLTVLDGKVTQGFVDTAKSAQITAVAGIIDLVLGGVNTVINTINAFKIEEINNRTIEIKAINEQIDSRTSQTFFKLQNVETDVDWIEAYLPGISIHAGNAATRSLDALTILEGFEPVISSLPGVINQIGANINQLDGNINTQFSSLFTQLATLTQITGGVGSEVQANGSKLDLLDGKATGIDTKAGSILNIVEQFLPVDLSSILQGLQPIKSDTEEIKGLISNIDFDVTPITQAITDSEIAIKADIAQAKGSIESGLDELGIDITAIKANTDLIPQVPTDVKNELQPDFENIFDNLPEVETTTTRINACNLEGFIDIPSNILKFKKQSAGSLLRPVLSALDFLVGQACPDLDDDENIADYLPRIELRPSQRFSGLNEAGGIQFNTVNVPTLVIKNRTTGEDETLEGFNDLLFEELANVNPARTWRYLPRIITKESNVDGTPKALPLLEIRDTQDDQVRNMEEFNDELFAQLSDIKETIDVTEYEEIRTWVTDPQGQIEEFEFPDGTISVNADDTAFLIEFIALPVGIGRRFGGDTETAKFNLGSYAFRQTGQAYKKNMPPIPALQDAQPVSFKPFTTTEQPIERISQLIPVPMDFEPTELLIYLIPDTKAVVSRITRQVKEQDSEEGN